MESIFNELSFEPLSKDVKEANDKINDVLRILKLISNHSFKILRIREDFWIQKLAPNYTFQNWLDANNVSRIHKDLLLGLTRYPYIGHRNENIENLFIENDYSLYAPLDLTFHDKEVEGLAVAYFGQSCTISFNSYSLWESHLLQIQEKNKKTIQNVPNISSKTSYQENLAWLSEFNKIDLVKTALTYENKKIKLREDHGKDILIDFGKKILRNEYVVSIVNSLPFNPNQKSFIKACRENGLIEIVLTWTDQGYGLVVQSTGRNLAETTSISEILAESYEK